MRAGTLSKHRGGRIARQLQSPPTPSPHLRALNLHTHATKSVNTLLAQATSVIHETISELRMSPFIVVTRDVDPDTPLYEG